MMFAWTQTLLAMLVLFSGSLLAREPEFSTRDEEIVADHTYYISVIDAGSLSSRIYLFAWNTVDSDGNPNIFSVSDSENKHGLNKKRTPGLSAVEPKDVESYLKPLLEFIKEHLRHEELSHTEVFLRTTDMGLVNPQRAKDVYTHAVHILRAEGFKVDSDTKRLVDTLSGDEGSQGSRIFRDRISRQISLQEKSGQN